MTEFIMSVFTLYVLNVWGMVGLTIATIFLLNFESRFFSLVFGGLVLYIGWKLVIPPSIPWYLLIASYLMSGFLWSLWRYKRFVDEEIDKLKSEEKQRPSTFYTTKQLTLRSIKNNISLRNKSDDIALWILLFPFSMVENLIPDLLDSISNFVKNFISGFYNSISNYALKKLQNDENLKHLFTENEE